MAQLKDTIVQGSLRATDTLYATDLKLINPLPIDSGGTGATTAGAARSNIEEGNFLSCSTAAATAAKTVAYTGFELNNGIVINIKFTVQNTATSPTLNVNSTGAKAIWCQGTRVQAEGLAYDYVYRLMYDGTQWQVLNPPMNLIGVCGTTVNTQKKTATISGFVPFPGARVNIKFTNNNSYRTGILSLNINGYGDYPIYNNGLSKSTCWYTFEKNHYYEFICDGSNYYTSNLLFRRDTTLGVSKVTNSAGEVTTQEVHGVDYLYLGNNVTSTANYGMTGGFRLYGAGENYLTITAQKQTADTNINWYFPPMSSSDGGTTRYFVSHSNTNAVGSATTPIYLNTNGRVAECASMIDLAYPIGSIYITTSSEIPSITFPATTWERFGMGKVLVGMSPSNNKFGTIEDTGGSETATLTAENLPAHAHHVSTKTSIGIAKGTTIQARHADSSSGLWDGTVNYQSISYEGYNGQANSGGSINYLSGSEHTHSVDINEFNTDSTGSGTAINIMNPYIVVYMWKRIA